MCGCLYLLTRGYVVASRRNDDDDDDDDNNNNVYLFTAIELSPGGSG